jgi:hypothetical protein
MSSRAKSRDLPNAEGVTQVGEILRSEPDWHIAQDDTVELVGRRVVRLRAWQSNTLVTEQNTNEIFG